MTASHTHKLAVVEVYISAFATGDAGAAAALYAPDATIEDPVGSSVVSGPEAILALYRSAMDRGLKLERTGQVCTAGDSAAFPFRILYPPQAGGIDVIDTFRFDQQGRIVQMRAFWGPDNIHLSEESQDHA